MVYIRADANAEIGTGHIMRCLALANAFRQKGVSTTFITADHYSDGIIADNNYQHLCLNSIWNDLDQEIEIILQLIQIRSIDLLIIDSYFVTAKYLDKIRQKVKIIYFDDLNNFIYPVDILINYNIYANKIIYEELYRKQNTELMISCKYAPLREEFQNSRVKIREAVSNIMITTGGSDITNMISDLLKFVQDRNEFNNITFHVVIGRFNQYRMILEEMAEQDDKIKLHTNVTEMSKLMQMCDIAVTAGGSTLFELCACGLPSISFSCADNQLNSVKEFNQRDIIYYAGDSRDNKEACINNIEQRLDCLIKNYELRLELSKRMSALVDGEGANRIVYEILRI